MNNNNAIKYLIGIILLGIIILIFVNPFNTSKKAVLKNKAALKQYLSEDQIDDIREGLYYFKKQNKIKYQFSVNVNSIKEYQCLIFEATYDNTDKVYVYFDKANNTCAIRHPYLDVPIWTNAENNEFDYLNDDTKYLEIQNEDKLKFKLSETKERFLDSLSAFTQREGYYNNYYVLEFNETDTNCTVKLVSLLDHTFVLTGTVDKQKQSYEFANNGE